MAILSIWVVTPCCIASNNIVLDWNKEIINATRISRNPPPVAALHYATFHLAIYDTINSFTQTHQPWLVDEPAPEGANMAAAIAAAAYLSLDTLFEDIANPQNLLEAYEEAIADIPEGIAKSSGLQWGKKVAAKILAERSKTPLPSPDEPYSSMVQGIWRETPIGFRPAVAPRLGEVKPFALHSASQFRAPPPPPLNSKEYAEELEYVKKVGRRDGAQRTEDQTLTTPFWADDLGTATPAGHWNLIAQDIAAKRELNTAETARLFALLNIAGADSGITCWETKYHYRTWRPETAIREMDPSINPYVQTDPDFIPNMASPAFPSYTSGHSTYTAAMSRLIELYFGTDDIAFSITSDGLPGAVRSFDRISDARFEVGMSRVWGGIHVMSDNIEGQKVGIAVADWIFSHSLLPK